MSADAPALFLYRWRLRPGAEDAFVAAWTDATRDLLHAGSLGSRLHRGDDGLWYGYAQWPGADRRDAAFVALGTSSASKRMHECVAETLPPVALAAVADFLRPLPLSASIPE
jgi:hypothetical protein